MTAGLTWHASTDVVRGTRADATRHARPRGRATRDPRRAQMALGGTDTWQGPHESTRTPKGAPHGESGLAVGGPMG